MTTLELWLLGIGLAMDCFTVSITSGIIMRRICWRTFFTMALFFGVFQAFMPVIGWFVASHFNHLIEAYDHWIAFALLAFLGGRMIKESFNDETESYFDPTRLKVIVTLAIATSIDALAVGISFAFMDIRSFSALLSPILIIGVCSFVLSLAGSLIGLFCGKHFKWRTELWGGIILIAIGVKILIEHLFCN